MLNLLRRGVRTWVAKVLFGLLVISFAIWGIGDVFNFGIGSSVATVGDQKISAERYANALNREIRATSQSFGQPIDADMARTLGLPQRVLARLAQEATLDQTMAELQVSAPDEAVSRTITADPSFQGAAGGFDQANYRYILAQNGYSVEAYEDNIRSALARQQLVRALTDGASAPQGAVQALYDFQTETRTFDLITLGEAMAGDIGEPGEDEIKAYYDAHQDEFISPERRSAVYLNLALNTLGADYQPDEDLLHALYDRQAAEFSEPERRALYQIVFNNQAQAQAAADRIAKGEADFDAILKERDETRADTSLGLVTADDLAPATGEAAFALAAPGVAGPVDTGFGFSLLDVTEIIPAKTTSFEEAKDMLTAELRREHALDLVPEIAGEVEDRRASGATLEEIAESMGLPLGKAEDISTDNDVTSGLPATSAFIQELFSAEEGEERDLVETPDGSYFVLRVEKITPESCSPLDDVRERAALGWHDQAVQDALTKRADEITTRIGAGETLADIAAELGLEVTSEGPKTRNAGWQGAPGELVAALFEAEQGEAAQAANRLSVTIGTVAAIAPGPETAQTIALRDVLTQQMNGMAANDVISLYIMAKQQEAGTTVNQAVIDSVLTQISGF